MRTFLILLVLGLCGGPAAWSQAQPTYLLPHLEQKRPITRTGLVTVDNSPLLLLGAQETDYASLVVDPKEIKVVQAYRDSAILAPLGAKARHGVLVIALKSPKTLLKLDDVLDYFQVPADQRHLRVLLNKRPVNRTRFLADVARIQKVEVIQLEKTSPVRFSWNENEQFLNLVTAD
ncbi:hypothetical protein [Rufibacter psychrotolerans]|uniref:hypothetical protein n=1 Tax=Rufibacter psychrotolerans TaxID=2812556 RepID=UPI001968022D|nr:hypothetical protein [Rufibacter sp. SYSU D00308]